MNLVTKAMLFAINAHANVNHRMDGHPYSVHLAIASSFAQKHALNALIPRDHKDEVFAAVWLHDVIEDARVTYSDLYEQFGDNVANLVYAVTNEKGRTRKERASAKYYEEMGEVRYAKFVKLCDRLANVQYSKETGSEKLEMYRKENSRFLLSIISNEEEKTTYLEMISELNSLFND